MQRNVSTKSCERITFRLEKIKLLVLVYYFKYKKYCVKEILELTRM